MSAALLIALFVILGQVRKPTGAGGGRAGGAGERRHTASAAILVVYPISIVVLAIVAASEPGPLWCAVWALLLCPFWFPWTLAMVAARIGWVGGARVLGWFALWALNRDRSGGVWLAPAIALARRRRHDERIAARIELALRRSTDPVRGAGLAVRGLLAASRGLSEEARDLLRSVEHLPAPLTPAVARRVARSWLASDAAARGDWREVARLGAAPGPRGADVRFLAACARRLLGAPGTPSDLALRLRWLLASRRRATRPLLGRALAAPRQRGPGLSAEPGSAASSLVRAAELHAAALSRDALLAADLGALGRAWSVALVDPGTEEALLRRELALGADGKSDATRRLAARVRAELAWLVRESGVGLASLDGGAALERAAGEVRGEWLLDLEAQAGAIGDRSARSAFLAAPEEWRGIARLRERYREVAGRLGEGDRPLAYAAIHSPLCSVACHLFNAQAQRPMAHATFLFLAAEASAAGDATNAELFVKNARCGA